MRAPLLLAGVVASLAITTPASAATLLPEQTVRAGGSVARTCQAKLLSTRATGVAQRHVTTSATGLVRARLSGSARADWDVAVFDRSTRKLVAASAYSGSTEIAEGLVVAGRRLTVQACRRSRGSSVARLSVHNIPLPAGKSERIRLARVLIPHQAAEDLLMTLDPDLTEHGRPGYLDVLLHGDDDLERLRASGLAFTIQLDDVVAADRAAMRGKLVGPPDGPMPSGRVDYRRLADFGTDLKKLATDNPGLVEPITLAFPSLEGRPIEGIEITKDVKDDDGKPVFLQMGVHHAREWPSAEMAMEFAFELVNKFNAGDARVTDLLARTRVIVVPVINPDGFNLSREEVAETYQAQADPGFAYKRKNCRVADGLIPAAGECGLSGNRRSGTDPNRNYGQFWGGNGASASASADTYRGAGQFSEPETQNVQRLVSSRQITTLITNHTYSDLVLRPPGLASQGPTPDEDIYKELGDAMAAENGYTSQLSYQLYDTTGTTEDWSYHATGGLGFTFEIGPGEASIAGGAITGSGFHPPYPVGVIAEWYGKYPQGGGNREAYYIALESTANTTRHSIIEGTGPAGSVIRLRKAFDTYSSKTKVDDGEGSITGVVKDKLNTTMTIPASGTFEYHANPSTRPITIKDEGPAEAWELSCEAPDGTVLGRSSVVVDRGRRKSVGNACGGLVTQPAAADKLRVRLASVGRLPRSLSSLKTSVACSRICNVTVQLRVDGRSKRRMGLRSAVLGRAKVRDIGGRTTVRVKLSGRTRSKLRRQRKAKLTVHVAATSADGARARTSRPVKRRS